MYVWQTTTTTKQVVDGGRKLRCKLNGHTFPNTDDDFSRFVDGKKFKRLLREEVDVRELRIYEPFITRSTNFDGMLFCSLTGSVFSCSVAAAKKHVTGGKYKRALERHNNGKQDLLREPTQEEVEAEMEAAERGDIALHPDGMPMDVDENELPRRKRAGSGSGGGGGGGGGNVTTKEVNGEEQKNAEKPDDEDFEFDFMSMLPETGDDDDNRAANPKRRSNGTHSGKPNVSRKKEREQDKKKEKPRKPKIVKKDAQARKRRATDSVHSL